MPYEQQALEAPHKLTLDGRSRLAVTGVRDVESFDESTIVMDTSRGVLVVQGENLHLQNLSLEGGQVTVDGSISTLIYEEDRRKGGFLGRLFG